MAVPFFSARDVEAAVPPDAPTTRCATRSWPTRAASGRCSRSST